MNNKEHFDLLVKSGVKNLEPTERVRSLVTFLLDSLQKPDLKHVTILDQSRVVMFGLDDSEPVNWASLNVSQVVPFEDYFLVDIEEAAPDACPVVICRTEW